MFGRKTKAPEPVPSANAPSQAANAQPERIRFTLPQHPIPSLPSSAFIREMPMPVQFTPLPPAATAVWDEPSRDMLKRVPVEFEVVKIDDPRKRLAEEAERLLGYSALRHHLKMPSRFKQALARLEIEVLDQKTVDAYKAQMVFHYESTNKVANPTWRITPLLGFGAQVPEYVLEKAVEIKRELPEAQFLVDHLTVDPFLIVTLVPIHDVAINMPRDLDPDVSAYVDVWKEPLFESKQW